MTKPMTQIHNAETNEVLEREMTDEEYEQYLENIKGWKANKKAREEKEAIRQSALSKLIDLGLTEEEIAAL
jgi:hypothetical protein